jgi:glycosyltransferase involved in cell wall biosynthesis
MRVGLVPFLDGSGGGVYQYSLMMLDSLYQAKAFRSDEFVIFSNGLNNSALHRWNGPGWSVKPLEPAESPSVTQDALNFLRRVIGEGPHREAWRRLRRGLESPRSDETPKGPPDPDVVRPRPEMRRWLRDCRVDLMIYPWPNPLSFEAGLPYIMAVHDLQHRLQPEFPEVSVNGEWEWREYIFRNGARHATLLLADSEVGKEDILNFYGPYGVKPDRVKILPFVPAPYLPMEVSEAEIRRVLATYHLPEQFLFYPAQFWPHKNHARIIRALNLLKQADKLNVSVVFCGASAGPIRERTLQEVSALTQEFSLGENVHFLGYVPDKDMAALYVAATGLLMPTFFGPTNIPVLEAWSFGCPVLTSDIRGIREQVGNAALLVDPKSVEALADGIRKLWTEQTFRQRLAELGHQRLADYSHGDFSQRLSEILEEAKTIVLSEKQRIHRRHPRQAFGRWLKTLAPN